MKYSECVSVALFTQNATRVRNIAICGLSVPSMFPHIISKKASFSGENFTKHKMCFDFPYKSV
jgi:fucose permease